MEKQTGIEIVIQSLQAELDLAKRSMDDFNNLSKSEKDEQLGEQLVKVGKLKSAFLQAVKDGFLSEANTITGQLEKEIKVMEEQIQAVEVDSSTPFKDNEPTPDEIAIDIYDQGIKIAIKEGKLKGAEEMKKARQEIIDRLSQK